MPLVTDDGFAPDSWRRVDGDEPLTTSRAIVPLDRLDEALAAGVDAVGVEVPADADLNLLLRRLHSIDLIALRFESFADGRGFSLASRLRRLGYTGRLRASGHVIADQWAFLKDCGIDEAEIDEAVAARQPEASWLRAASAISGSYQRRLTQAPVGDAGWTL